MSTGFVFIAQILNIIYFHQLYVSFLGELWSEKVGSSICRSDYNNGMFLRMDVCRG